MTEYVYNLGQRFSEIASRQGDRAALRYPAGRLVTYAQLDRHANRLAGILHRRGLRRRDVIGIVHTKTTMCYAAMIAALKLGLTYVNLDDQNPRARLEHIFSTARPKIVLAEGEYPDVRDAAVAAQASYVNAADPDFAHEMDPGSCEAPKTVAEVSGTDPAYIMYTSGSTGIPKGALITHGNILNFGQWCAARFGITPDDVLTNVNPMYFDNSVFDFYGALLNGASIAPITRQTLADPALAVSQIEESGCTTWFSVPSLLIYLTTMRLLTPDRLPTIRQFVFGGEGYPKPELRKLFSAFGHRSLLVNVYGPTECTCICSAWDVTEADLADPTGLVTLGPVAQNFTALVLENGRQVQPGEVGELCLLGPQVGLGYVNDAERTGMSFVQNPLNAAWREPMYRTGDLVRFDADGRNLHFVGRADNQVKHMGYRIELEEIEAAINRLDGIIQSAVVQKTGRGGVKILVAYLASDSSVTDEQLRAGLQALLPAYMIPQRFDVRTTLPKNANGKVDRVALAAE